MNYTDKCRLINKITDDQWLAFLLWHEDTVGDGLGGDSLKKEFLNNCIYGCYHDFNLNKDVEVLQYESRTFKDDKKDYESFGVHTFRMKFKKNR